MCDDDVYVAGINADDESAASRVSEGHAAGHQSTSANSRRQKNSLIHGGARSPALRTAVQPQVSKELN